MTGRSSSLSPLAAAGAMIGVCCTTSAQHREPCPSCGEVGSIVGAAPVRPHRTSARDGAWKYCQNIECHVVYYLADEIVDADEVRTQVGHKATDKPMPVCFCFAHTAVDIGADADAHEGVSAIKAEVKAAVANGHCACEHLSPSGKCCLADIHRTLKSLAATHIQEVKEQEHAR